MASHIINDYIAGAIGGAAGLVVGHPFDTTKVQLQTNQGKDPYGGTMDAFRSIKKQGLVKGFFRGMGFPLASYGVINSVFFGVYGNTLMLMGVDKKHSQPTVTQAFVGGCWAGTVQLLVACPVDVVKCVLQSQIPHSHDGLAVNSASKQFFRGPMDCIRYVMKTNGILGFYRGIGVMAGRDIPGFAVYILVYEELYYRLLKSSYSDRHGIMASLVGGGTAGAMSWITTMPLDMVKSVYQSDTDQKYKSNMDCAKAIYKSGGMRAFFVGTGVTVMRAFPTNGLTFLVYEQAAKYLNRINPDKSKE